MISIQVIGKLYQDSVIKQGSKGEYLQFSVGVRDDRGDDGRMMYFDVNTNQMGLADILKTNKQVCVIGTLKSREYNEKIYFSIRGPRITLLGGADASSNPPRDETSNDQSRNYDAEDMDDEIPF